MYHVMMKIAKFKILSSEYPACAGEDGDRMSEFERDASEKLGQSQVCENSMGGH